MTATNESLSYLPAEDVVDGELLEPEIAQGGEVGFTEGDITEVEKTASSVDGINLYLKLISRYPLLTQKEEQELGTRVRDGDLAAKEQMILANLRLVVFNAKRYLPFVKHMNLLDLIQEGNTGLLRAVEKFDPERGVRFSTYATPWIRNMINRSMAEQDSTIRKPASVHAGISWLRAQQKRIKSVLNEEPNRADLLDELLAIESQLGKALDDTREPLSLDSSFLEDGAQLHEVITDSTPEAQDPTIYLAHDNQVSIQLIRSLKKLPTLESYVLASEYGIGRPTKTVEELSMDLGTSVEEILRLEQTGIDSLLDDGDLWSVSFDPDDFEPDLHSNSNASKEVALQPDVIDGLPLLPDRLRYILENRLSLNGYEPKSLAMLGRELGLSRERIRQLQNEALELLKTGVIDETSDTLVQNPLAVRSKKESKKWTPSSISEIVARLPMKDRFVFLNLQGLGWNQKRWSVAELADHYSADPSEIISQYRSVLDKIGKIAAKARLEINLEALDITN